MWRKELNLFLNLTQRIEPFSNMTPSFERLSQNDSKNWIFLNVTQRIEPFFFKMWLKELNLFSTCDSKNWTSFWIWFRELNFCLNYTTQSQRIEPSFFVTTQRIEHFFCMWIMFSNDSKIFFWKISQRIDFSYDSKNGTWR